MFQLILTVLLYTSFDLYKARVFNAHIAPTLAGASYREFRKSLNNHGLSYKDTSCTIGSSYEINRNQENCGHVLFAQFKSDRIVSLNVPLINCEMLVYYNRLGPPCTCADECDNIIEGCPLWLHKKHNTPPVP